MRFNAWVWPVATAHALAAPQAEDAGALRSRYNNGLGRFPALGWNSWVSLIAAPTLHVAYERTTECWRL
jgi:hypothetical protein